MIEKYRLLENDLEHIGVVLKRLGEDMRVYRQLRETYDARLGIRYNSMSVQERMNKRVSLSAELVVYENRAYLSYEDANVALSKIGSKLPFAYDEWLKETKEDTPTEEPIEVVMDYQIKAYKQKVNYKG